MKPKTTKRKTKPISRPAVRPRYRELSVGETVRAGDEFQSSGRPKGSPVWITIDAKCTTDTIGTRVRADDSLRFRRPVHVSAWKRLRIGAIIRKGDQYRNVETGDYMPCTAIVGIPVTAGMIIRRKIGGRK